jgi:hypothetical protein
MKVYDLVANKPVAHFAYQGESHNHPVWRTVLVTKETDTLLIGYEIQEGKTKRKLRDVVANKTVKSYRKDKIAKFGDYKRLRMCSKHFLKPPEQTTLVRSSVRSISQLLEFTE